MRWSLVGLLGLLVASAGWARGERAGAFEYYVLSLSWSPTWCAIEGDARQSPQCDQGFGWVMHGLWPQYTRGWPSYCPTAERSPSRAMTRGMADVMGTSGLAWHQWTKHGVCSGLSAQDYFALSRQAYERVVRPDVFRRLDREATIPASLVEQAYIRANPQLSPDMITITCKDGRIQEARICLSRSLGPAPCGADVVRDCQMEDALFAPIR